MAKSTCICFLSALLLISFVTIAVLGYLLFRADTNKPPLTTGAPPSANGSNPYDILIKADLELERLIRDALLSSISRTSIRENLLQLTQKVHVAGSPQNLRVADMLQSFYENLAISGDLSRLKFEVRTHNYSVLLGYPDYQQPNSLHVRDVESHDWTLLSSGKGQRLGPEAAQEQQADPKALVWFYAYSPSGEVTAPLVYAGFGSKAEVDLIESMGVHINGSIVLVKGGGPFELEKRGAVAVIKYVDPQVPEYGIPDGFPSNFTFPNSVFMPPTDVLRFSVKNSAKMNHLYGDLLTENYPSKPYVPRDLDYAALQRLGILPSIPLTPVSMNVGASIFSSMDGVLAPPALNGKLPGVTYRLNAPGKMYKLKVSAVNDNRRRIKNICTYVRGNAEPDHLVILSNHYDAETFGAFDPNSGTAVMMELARVLVKVITEHQWTPRRTIVFCHWDAQEYGMVGSTEWVEEHVKLLQGRAVALLNVDIGDGGNLTMVGYGVPSLHETLWRAAKVVPNPNPNEIAAGRTSVFDSWLHYYPNEVTAGEPWVGNPIIYSDDYPFTAFAGVPSTVHMFVKENDVCGGFPCYGLFHTMYDIEWTVENLVDKQFRVNTALGQVWLEMARSLADSVVIPFNVTTYGTVVRSYVNSMIDFLEQRNVSHPEIIPNFGSRMVELIFTVNDFRYLTSMSYIQGWIELGNSGVIGWSLRKVAKLNKRLVALEQAFINTRGIYGKRSSDRHILFSASLVGQPEKPTFPAVVDTTSHYLAAISAGQAEQAEYWRKQLSNSITDIQYALESANLILDMS